MCCLKNEQETYEYLNSRLPVVGDTVQTDDGFQGEVNSVSVLRQLVKVLIDNGDEKELREYHVEQLSFRPRRRKDVKLTAEELKELKALEDDQNDAEEKDHNGGSRSNRPNNHRNQDRNQERYQDRPQRENRRDYKKEPHYQNRSRKKNNKRDFEGREKRREQSRNHDAE